MISERAAYTITTQGFKLDCFWSIVFIYPNYNNSGNLLHKLFDIVIQKHCWKKWHNWQVITQERCAVTRAK
jgi:hypothetical protein